MRPDEVDRQVIGVAAVAALADPARHALYRVVVDAGNAVSREQAARAAGVSRATAAFHLDKLVAEGLLEVEFRRLTGRSGPGAGRPAKLYRRSGRQVAVSLPPRQYDLAGHLLAGAMEEAEPDAGNLRRSLARVARRRGAELAAAVRQRTGRRRGRLAHRRALVDVISDTGFEPVLDETGVVLRNCPFHDLAREHTDLVCGMNLELLSGLVEEVPDAGLRARLEPEPGRCCVVLVDRGRPAPAPDYPTRFNTARSSLVTEEADVSSDRPTHKEVVDATADAEATMKPQRVPVNVYETGGALVIVAPLPAVTASDVTIELRPGALRFWARLRSAAPRDYLVNEWDYGGYEREVEIPDGFGAGVEATLSNGQLAVRVLRGEATDTVTTQPAGA
jgi:predicted ArsR family transcriptional regulator/HSP20 family molecular chaperone IbpA